VAALLLASACGGGNSLPTGPSPVAAEVEFRYVLAEGQSASVEDDFACEGQMRLYPSFWGFAQVTLRPVEARTWGALFEEVPVGRQSVRLRVPEACAGGNLYANGVPILDGAAAAGGFVVSSDGSVTR
jgi:hypothetical protein